MKSPKQIWSQKRFSLIGQLKMLVGLINFLMDNKSTSPKEFTYIMEDLTMARTCIIRAYSKVVNSDTYEKHIRRVNGYEDE